MSSLPKIIAHRGYSTRFRENSPAAWRGAMEAGADAIEVDLRVTADWDVVCMHDKDLKRLAGRDDLIAQTSTSMLAGIEADGFPAAPPLALLFETVPAHGAILFDIKDERPEALDRYLAELGRTGRTNLILGLHAIASVAHVREAGWSGEVLGFLRDADEEDAFFPAGGDIIRLWESVASRERIAHHVNGGRPVWVTTGEHETGRKVGDHDPDALRRMARDGATGFLVNDPVAARAALNADAQAQ
jgi:glycerophosphoryl diester phosphodiesterase